MITQLSFGALKVTRLTLGETRLKIVHSVAPPQTLTLLNIGVPGKDGKDGEGLDAFSADPLAYYILAKN